VAVRPGRGADGAGADRASADQAARLLRACDERGLLEVRAGPGLDLAGLVIAVGGEHAVGEHAVGEHAVGEHAGGEHAGGVHAADVRLVADASLPDQVSRLWADRVGPFARRLARIEPDPAGAPVLAGHDPARAAAAARLLGRLRAGLRDRGVDDGTWTYDHIGSTSVPGLKAKPYIDLQVGVTDLPAPGSPAEEVVSAAGFHRARGARPDSPGVDRDGVLEPAAAWSEAVYRKRLYFRPDPAAPAILHVRLLGAPWWSYTVAFRDWLRGSQEARRAYEAMKERVAAEHASDGDYDDYTRGKTAFFLEWQHAWAAPPGSAPSAAPG
jgi:dephospho-CoA kinase